MKVNISILTPSIRPEGLAIVDTALARQSFKSFEWIVCGPENLRGEVEKNIKKNRYIYIGNPPLKESMIWDLNFSYNRLIKESKGDLLVSWQDYTFADPTALEKYWFHFVTEPKTLVSGVGNKYESVYPELGAMTWKDPREREDQGTYYYCFFDDIEWNFCSIPKKAMFDIGGFDESLDYLGFGLDGYSVNERLSYLGGYEFALDQTIKSYSLGHGRVKNWEEENLIHGRYEPKRIEYKSNPKLSYL